MNREGAVKTLIKELKQYKVDILAVQETHLKEKSVQEVDEYILYNSGGNDRRFGVGFAVNKIPGRKETNQIDHVLVQERYAHLIKNVRTYRGADVDSDHFLVVVKMKEIVSGGGRRFGPLSCGSENERNSSGEKTKKNEKNRNKI
ncbi:hypothetical protein QE152_g1864 [Popillia japonica]|uniref:Endonuclease/exonuclease/phosphatase domain-containing protein n=1 Tax=Popillia japonica TaxID=7064 RepID=A0AAW1N5N6_POPJA